MWFWLAFGSALLGAVDIVLNKQCLNKVSAAVLTWSLFALSLPIITILTLKEGVPALTLFFYLGVLGSSIAFSFGKTITNETLKNNLVSKVFPLTAFSGLFTYILGLIFLSETIRPIPVLGLFSVIFGSYILNADQAKEDLLRPFKLIFMNKATTFFLFAILLGSITAIFDKVALKGSVPNSPVFAMLAEQVVMTVLLTAYLAARQPKWVQGVRNNFGILFLNSVIFLVVSLLVFTAYIDGPVALVLGIKRLQIFFVLLLGYLFFKDKPTRHAWVATIIMFIGVVMIRLG